MFALDELRHLAGGGWEHAVDELVNVAFAPTCEPPTLRSVDPDQLAAARERLKAAGMTWAAAVFFERRTS